MSALSDTVRRKLACAARSSQPAAIVFECSYVNGLSAIRSLAAMDVPVIAMDHRRQALGLRSRLAAAIVCPHPYEQPDEFAGLVTEICEALPHGAVAFPTHDEYLVAVN
ncbi:MAG: hypothetical protein ACRDQC_09135, partial [Gaiellales bacterium]